MITCGRCGAENPDGFRFCGSCGASLVAEAGEAREERKVVTALFADLVGFTGKAERLDPEDVRAMLSPYYARLRSEFERFGGTVEKFIGDAVMALFGAPVAHEDDPERAIRAALAIREAVAELNGANPGLDLHVRVGVTTWEALVTLGARPSEGEGMAAGDVVNTASRLQASAPVDGILVGEATYRATAAAIEYREADPVAAKGKAEPVPAWEVLQARARLGVDVVWSAVAPLVGRERELAVLTGALARARERSTQLVTLVGEPRIGKSRMVGELLQVVERDPDLIFWRQGRSLPYGEGVSFWALAEMVKNQAGILETDPDDVAGGKLDQAVGRLVTDGEDARWIVGHLRPWSAWAAMSCEATARPRRSPRGAASSRPWRSAVPPCWCSRTSTGRTRGCSTSSITSSSGPPVSPSWWCARPGPSCWPVGRGGAGGSPIP